MDLGIDCGGTKTEAIVASNGKIIDHFLVEMPSTKEVLVTIISNALKKHKISFIGIAFPSAVNDGKVTTVRNIPEWNNTNVQEFIYSKFKIKCKVENDAKCFALAESHANKCKNIVGITLGTGIGCGIVIDSKIHRGATGAAGEINLIPYHGKTIEDYTSSKFFKMKATDAKTAFARDHKSIKEYAIHLGKMLSIIVNTVEPEMIIFGGSISKGFNIFENEMKKELRKHVFAQSFRMIKIKKSSQKYAACIGAMLLK